MAKKPKEPAAEGLALESATPDRQNFTLDEQRAESLRSALDDGGSVTEFWARMGQDIGFNPETVVLIDTPETGPIQFSAIPTAALEPAGEALPEAPAEDGPTPYEQNLAERYDHMSAAVKDMDLASATLVGDLTEHVMELIKRLPKPFDAHSQHEKRELLARVELICAEIVEQTVECVAADGRECVSAFLDKITAGEKVTIGLKLSPMAEDMMADAVSQLYRCQGKPVLIVTADHRGHMGKRRDHLPPDQEALPFDAGTDAVAKPEPPKDDSDLNPFDKPEPEPEAETEIADSQVFWRSVGNWLKPGGKNWTTDRKEAGVWRPTKAQSLADELRDPVDMPHEIVKVGEEPEPESEEEQEEDLRED